MDRTPSSINPEFARIAETTAALPPFDLNTWPSSDV